MDVHFRAMHNRNISPTSSSCKHNQQIWSLWREMWNKPSWNGATPPPPSTLHLYTAQSYAFKAMLIIITIIMILQKIVAPEQVKDKWRISSSSHIRQLPAHTWCAGTCTSLPAMRALPLLLPCICSCHASAPAMHLNGLQQCGWS